MNPDQLAISVAEAADRIGISRSKAYQLVASGDLPTVRIGGKTLVPVERLRRWVNDRAPASGQPGLRARPRSTDLAELTGVSERPQPRNVGNSTPPDIDSLPVPSARQSRLPKNHP